MPQRYSKTPLPSPFKEENHNGLWLLERNMCLIFILNRWRLYLNSSRLTRKRERPLHTCSVKTTQNHICSKQLISYTRKLQQIARRYCPNPFPVKQHTHSSSGKLFKINKGVKTQSAGAFFLLFLQHFAYFYTNQHLQFLLSTRSVKNSHSEWNTTWLWCLITLPLSLI